jgi:hypothetical protein
MLPLLLHHAVSPLGYGLPQSGAHAPTAGFDARQMALDAKQQDLVQWSIVSTLIVTMGAALPPSVTIDNAKDENFPRRQAAQCRKRSVRCAIPQT